MLSPGSTGAASLSRRAFLALAAQQADFRVDIDLVTLTFTAIDRKGHPVPDLRMAELKLLDNQQPVEIRHLWRDLDVPLTVGLIADVSITQAAYIAEHRQTIRAFLASVLQPRDHAFLVTTASDVVLLADLTNSVDDLDAAVGKIDAVQSHGKRLGPECPPRRISAAADGSPRFVSGCGGSDLWDAVFHSARLKLQPLAGRRALIFLTDGLDTGSVHSLSDAIEASQSADAFVYTIYCRTPTSSATPTNLLRLSSETGGRSFDFTGRNLQQIFARIEADLRSVHVLAFRPPPEASDGRFRRIKLATTRPGVTLRTRPGYTLTR